MRNLAEFFQEMPPANWLLLINVFLLLLSVFFLVMLLRRRDFKDVAKSLEFQVELLERGQARLEQAVREEIARNRGELLTSARQQREELGQSLKGFNDSVLKGMTDMGQLLREQMESFSKQIQHVYGDQCPAAGDPAAGGGQPAAADTGR